MRQLFFCLNFSEIYAFSDIFVLPSSTETFGNVVLEAMASGIPVIGADAGGVRNIIKHRVNGLKFKPKDSQQLIENREMRDRLKAAGTQSVANRSWDRVFNGLIGNYEEILMKKGNSKFISA